jgi:cytosine deaminase
MHTHAYELILSGGRLADGRAMDLGLADGMIKAIASPGSLGDGLSLDLAGGLILPGLVEGHIHLDKTLLGLPWIPHVPGNSVRERIAAEKALRRRLGEPMAVRAQRLVEHVVARGTVAMRSHVDIDEEVKLDHLEALLALREGVRHLVDIQLVAFPQSGVASLPGAAALLDAALGAGADLLGGLDPAGIDGDVAGQLDILFRLAAKHGVGIDIHLHDPAELGCQQLRDIAERTHAAGLDGKVVVSHAYALGAVSEKTFGATAEALARADVAIMTNGPAGSRPPVKRLLAEGVTVFAGSDNIRDAWSPYGNGDMLDRARHIGYLNGLDTDADLELAFGLATSRPALVMGLAGHGITEGARADLVVVHAENIAEAVATAPPRLFVIKAGRIVAREGKLAA